MSADTTRGLETSARNAVSLSEQTDCPGCGRPLETHGYSSAGPGRTHLSCGLDVSERPLQEIDRGLSSDADNGDDLVTDGGVPESLAGVARADRAAHDVAQTALREFDGDVDLYPDGGRR